MTLSPAIPTGEFEAKGRKFGHSSFNNWWLEELGITPKVIFDIGGYDAGDAIRFKNYFQCQVYCFEADPVRAKSIANYIEDYDVRFVGAAFSDQTGKTPFYTSLCMLKDAGDFHSPGEPGGQGSIFRHTENYSGTYPHIKQCDTPRMVPCITLSDFCKSCLIEQIDLAHIDVEGAEWNVIAGFGDVRPKLVYIEVLKGMFEGAKDAEALLRELGYKLIGDFGCDKLYMI
jgi:FkbM family methyltransferase